MTKKLFLLVLGLVACLISHATPEKSLTFNGVNQFIQIPNSTDFQMTSTENVSFSVWVKPSEWKAPTRIIGYRNGNDAESAYELYILASGYACTATGIVDAGGSGRPIDTVLGMGNSNDAWTHIVVVFDRDEGASYAYVNGTRVNGKVFTTDMVFESTRDLLLGAGWNSSVIDDGRYFAGEIANVRFYKGVLTSDQASTDMNTNEYSSLPEEMKTMCVAAYQPSDDFTSLVLSDLTGNGHNGTMNNYSLPGYIGNVTVEQITDFTGRKNQYDPILKARVSISEGSPVLSGMTITLDGTTDISDYSKVNIYSTGTTSTFDERTANGATLLGSFTPSEGTMICNLSQTMTLTGTQYLWIVAEVSEEATEGNKLDATIVSLTTDNETYTVTSGNPEGNREILLARKLLYAPGDNGSVGYRIPAMVILPNGNIVTAIDRRWNSEGDLANKIDIIAKISEDGGYTWSEEYPIAIASDANNGRGDCALVVANDGSIIAAFVGGNGLWASSASDPIASFISRSTDGGKTWSSVEEGGAGDITKQIWGSECGGDNIRTNGKAAFFGSGRGLCLSRQTGDNADKNGRIMFVTAVNNGGTLYNYVVYSDDNGLTWKVSDLAFSGGDEAKVTELNDGTILMSVRRSGERGYNKSTDGGETWSTQNTWSSLNVNACNGDILEYTTLNDGYDTNRTLQSLPINDGNKVRTKVSVYLSYDEGTTWERKKQMFPSNSGYSTLIMLPDGSIGMYAEDQRAGTTSNYFMRFSLSWLTDGADSYTEPGTRVATPVISPEDGTVFYDVESAEITITCETENASIYYTTDGSNPTAESGEKYDGVITITGDCTIKAIACAENMTDSRIVSASYTFRERVYCTYEGNSTHSSRKLNSISMQGGTSSFSIDNIDSSTSHPIYQDLTQNVFEAEAGVTITPVIDWDGSWMHGYLYIDYDKDCTFSYTLGSDNYPTTDGELVSYTFYHPTRSSTSGRNSKGEIVTNGSGFENGMPSFTLPADLAPGDYRVRFKIDWNHLDPCGHPDESDNLLTANGGNITDFTLRIIEGTNVSIDKTLSNDNVTVFASNGKIVINSDRQVTVQIYTTDGVLFKAPLETNGYHTIAVPQGMYIVKVNGTAKLLSVR